MSGYTKIVPAVRKDVAPEDDPSGQGVYMMDYKSSRRELTDQAAIANTVMHFSPPIKEQNAEGRDTGYVHQHMVTGEYWIGYYGPVARAARPALGASTALQGAPIHESGPLYESNEPAPWANLPATPMSQAGDAAPELPPNGNSRPLPQYDLEDRMERLEQLVGQILVRLG